MQHDSTALSPLPAPGPDAMAEETALANLARHAEQARGAYAPNTERALRADVASFTGWCAAAGLTSLPASPDTLARYVDALAGHRAPATIRRALSSVATFHRAAACPAPRPATGRHPGVEAAASRSGTHPGPGQPPYPLAG